jgi:hypothetical protein
MYMPVGYKGYYNPGNQVPVECGEKQSNDVIRCDGKKADSMATKNCGTDIM